MVSGMAWMRLAVLLSAPLLLACLPARAADGAEPAPRWRIPPVVGEIGGDLQPLAWPGAPKLTWQVAASRAEGGIRVLGFTARSAGSELRGELRLDAAGDGEWRLAESRLDLAEWSAGLPAWLGESFAGLELGGVVTCHGEGTLRRGEWSGRARIVWRDGRLAHAARAWRVEGVELALAVADLRTWRTEPGQTLRWSSGEFATHPFGRGVVVFALAAETVAVDEASVAAFGGELVLAPFALSLRAPQAAVIARVVGLDVAHLVRLLPSVLTGARGRVDGSVALQVSGEGVRVGRGSLALRPGEQAELRLAPRPGLLTDNLPATVLRVYPGLPRIERGEVPIRAESLEVTFSPQGDAEGRTAALRILGGPVDPALRAPIDLNVNIRGPLDPLIRLGTHPQLTFGGEKR